MSHYHEMIVNYYYYSKLQYFCENSSTTCSEHVMGLMMLLIAFVMKIEIKRDFLESQPPCCNLHCSKLDLHCFFVTEHL